MKYEQSSPEQLQREYEEIEKKKTEFEAAYQKTAETGETAEAQSLKKEIQERMAALREKLWPFESLPQEKIREQYESQKAILERVGVLEKLSSGELGIRGIDNKEYAFPGYKEIVGRLKENKELMETKAEQGFTKLLIVPFGMKLDDLIEKYRQVVLQHYVGMPDPQDPSKRIPDLQKTKLFAAKKDPQNPKEQLVPLELDENQPVFVWDAYQNADIEGKLVYYPNKFSQDPQEHRGKTKLELLQKEKQGFHILLLEDLPNIPREGQGKEIQGRKQLEANKAPNTYLQQLQEKPYQGESGLTPEDWLTYAISHLEETDQVIDDWQGKGSINYNLGGYFPSSGSVPHAYWDRVPRRAYLDRYDPGDPLSDCGARASVRV